MLSFSDTTPYSSSMLMQIAIDAGRFVQAREQVIPLAGMRALASMQRRPVDFSSFVREEDGVSLIAHIKRSAPDMDEILDNYQPMSLASRFVNLGARSLMVATNEKFYNGNISDLAHINQSVGIPLIRQDFIFNEYQIVEARAAGADAVVLMAALVKGEDLCDLISITQRNRMTAIVQVQSASEIRDAIQFEPRVIAISNRDLSNFEIDLDKTRRLRDHIPPHMLAISMGGLRSADDIAHVQNIALDAIVVGQALLTAPDMAVAMRDLFKFTRTP